MFLKVLVAVVLMNLCHYASACEVCGSVSGADDFGLSSGWGKHFIGMKFQHRMFTSQHPTLFEGEVPTFYRNKFNQLNLTGRYVPVKRIQLYGSLPYNWYSDSSVSINGLGDASFRLGYAVFYRKDSATDKSTQLWINMGVKAPTGSSDEREISTNLPNMQPGSGSWDYTIGAQYQYKTLRDGLSLEASYKINTPNFYRQRFGNRTGVTMSYFRSYILGEVYDNRILPQIGVKLEHAEQDYFNVSKNEINPYSGGAFVSAIMGCDLLVNNININVGWQLPIWQNFADGYVNYLRQFSVGLKYIIQ